MADPSFTVPHLETSLRGPLLYLEQQFLSHQQQIETWLNEQWTITRAPLYGSVDCRNAGFKIAPIDTNIFPAGWNNLDTATLPQCAAAAKTVLSRLCPDATRLLIVPESHSRNLAYFENINTLKHILTLAGYEVCIGTTDPHIQQSQEITLPSGESLTLHPLKRTKDTVYIDSLKPSAIILNNDLSNGIPETLKNITQPILPAMQFGWTKRLKSEHFGFYQQVAEEFASQIEIDPWLINPLFDQCPEVDFMQRAGQECIQTRATALFHRIQQKYDEYNITHPPFLVIKADQGTYGMAVMVVRSAKELESLNRKQRTRMSSSKGGRKVTRAIIQEGVYSFETMNNNAVAEPVVYLFGHHVVGGFYRVHKNKGSDENLNAPGMNFTPLAFANSGDPSGETESINRFYTYGVISQLAMLAAARELHAFKGQTK